jgi:hypothetical protein
MRRYRHFSAFCGHPAVDGAAILGTLPAPSGGGMHRFANGLIAALVLAAGGLAAACSGGVIGGPTLIEEADVPVGVRNDNPMARPIAVAWTSARARRCGFYFDGARLRTSYLAYEAGQGNSREKLAEIEKSYDTTFKVISDKVAGDAGYCSDRKSAEIKADLQRHLAGDYTPKLPQPKLVQACGMFGCATPVSEQPFNTKSFWDKTDRDNPNPH